MFNNAHPRGLYTLFFTEMWERMSYYGMRGILVLFMTAAIAEGGLEIDSCFASAIYGNLFSCVYLVALIGGWLADMDIGQQMQFCGGFVIMLGHFLLRLQTFKLFIRTDFCCFRNRITKTKYLLQLSEVCMKTIHKKESGFTIFYMAINIGSILGFLYADSWRKYRLALWI